LRDLRIPGRPAERRPGGIDAEVDLCRDRGEFFLRARLDVHLRGIEPEVAQALVHGAHEICPYSYGTRGHLDVAIALV